MTKRCPNHILIIDDEAEIVAYQKEHLESLGFKVTAHTDSIAALNQFLLNPAQYRLVITDYSMPEMNGLELARIRSKERPDLPIIMVTGHLDLPREAIANAGIMKAFLKPMGIHQLTEIVNQALKSQKRNRTDHLFPRTSSQRPHRYC